MKDKPIVYRDSRGNLLNKTIILGDKIKTFKDGILVSDIPIDEYHDQLFVKSIKDTRDEFNMVWKIIDLMQANRAKKSEVHDCIFKASIISISLSIIINGFICLSIIAKVQH